MEFWLVGLGVLNSSCMASEDDQPQAIGFLCYMYLLVWFGLPDAAWSWTLLQMYLLVLVLW